MSSIGNSGARSSGPTGWSVPGCSGGGGGAGRSGITLYHWRGISDSSRVIFVRSVTAASHLASDIFSEPYAWQGTLKQPTGRVGRPADQIQVQGSGDERLDGRGQLGHRLLGVGEVHAGLGVVVQLVVQAGVAVPHRALDHDDGLGLVHVQD